MGKGLLRMKHLNKLLILSIILLGCQPLWGDQQGIPDKSSDELLTWSDCLRLTYFGFSPL